MLTAEHDVAYIAPLTKDDMITFYDRYISPTSPSRAKLSVHMLAQSTISNIALPKPSAQEDEGLDTGPPALEDGNLVDTDASKKGSAATQAFKEGCEIVTIGNVHVWKAGLQASAGPRSVRPLYEFEELDAEV